MAYRITQRDLENCVQRINALKGFSDQLEYSTIGSYVLSYAYGGVALHKYINAHGAIRDVFNCGHVPKRELYERMQSYMLGLRENNQE